MEGRSAATSAVEFWTPGRFCCGRAHPHLTTYHGQEGSSFFRHLFEFQLHKISLTHRSTRFLRREGKMVP